MTGPRTTLCIVARDRFSMAVASLEAILADLGPPNRIVYVDGGSPPAVRDALAELAIAHDFTLLRTEHYLTPNEARNLAFRRVLTEFVAFLDNDVFFTPGWLPTLEAAADRHGATVVAPVYGLAVGDLAKTGVHLAGAENHIVEENGHRYHHMHHDHEGADPAVLIPQLEPMLTEQAEFHCFFVRADAVRAIGGFDEDLLSLNEHLDASMRIREQGGEIWLEPAAMATYFVTERLNFDELGFYLLRWSRAWNEASIRRFQTVWDIDPDDPESAELLLHSDYKRYRAYRPYRSVMGRINAWRGKPNTRPLPDYVLAPLVARHERRRGHAQPPVVTHRATWDTGIPDHTRSAHG